MGIERMDLHQFKLIGERSLKARCCVRRHLGNSIRQQLMTGKISSRLISTFFPKRVLYELPSTYFYSSPVRYSC